MLDFSKDPASAARSVAPPRLRRQNAKINFPIGCAQYVRIVSAVDGVVRPRESISALRRHTMPHKIKDDDEADPAAAAGETAAAGSDAPAAAVLAADESAPAARTAPPPPEAPAAAEIAVAAGGDAAAAGLEAGAVGGDAVGGDAADAGFEAALDAAAARPLPADQSAAAGGTAPPPPEAPAASASALCATTGPALDDANVDPRWAGTLEPSEVGHLDYDALRIADGNKVRRVYPDADAGAEDADAKSATPQRDNRSAAEAPSAEAPTEAPSLSQKILAAAVAYSPRALFASRAGSVVGDHFGSGKAARGGGARALATEFEETTPAVAVAAAAAAPPVAATAAAAAAPPVAATAATATAAAAPAATAAAATAVSAAAVTTAATPAAPTFPSKPAPHEVAFLPADTTPVHKIFLARNGPG